MQVPRCPYVPSTRVQDPLRMNPCKVLSASVQFLKDWTLVS